MIRKNIVTRVVLLLSAALLIAGCSGKKADDKKTAGTDTFVPDESAEEEPQMVFPYCVDGTDLIIESLSQASIPNPDSDGTLTENIACIEARNNGDAYISKVEIVFEMEDEIEFTFRISDLPAGSSIQAFDVNNTVYNTDIVCKEITADELTEEEDSSLLEDELQIHVEETMVTLTNIQGDRLENLSVVCHCDMDGIYFGGRSYTYEVESVPAGGSIVLDASDCYLGQAAVVRVYRNN